LLVVAVVVELLEIQGVAVEAVDILNNPQDHLIQHFLIQLLLVLEALVA
jgi:hypothetical protein